MGAIFKAEAMRIHRNRLARMRNIKTASLKKLYESGEIIRADAQKSIRDGAVSGPGHIPSRPGEPPNADTHALDLSIDVVLNPSKLSVSVVAKAPYAAALEFGTTRIAERPFMRPALLRNRNRVVLGQVQAINEVVRVYKGAGSFAASRARFEAGK
jgi:HK97 gp10 family phage protein